MKKLLFSLLLAGMALGASAQQAPLKTERDLSKVFVQPVETKATAVKSSVLFSEAFQECANVQRGEGLALLFTEEDNSASCLSGTNYYGDAAFAQVYNLSQPVEVTGIAFFIKVLSRLDLEGEHENLNLGMYKLDANNRPTDEPIWVCPFNVAMAAGLATENPNFFQLISEEGLEVEAGANIASKFAMTCPVPKFTYKAVEGEENTYQATCDFLWIVTSQVGCYTPRGAWIKGSVNDGSYMWFNWAEVYEEIDPVDFALFPIIEGEGVALNQADLDQLTYVYPNPATDQISFASSLNLQKIELVNAMGQTVYSENVNGNNVTLNVDRYAKGTYVVKMFTANGVANKTVVLK